MSEMTRPLERLYKEASEYIDLKMDDLKLRTVKGLSVGVSEVLGWLIILFVASIVLIALAVGMSLLLGELIGSYAGGAFIVAGVFLILLLVLLRFRRKLFLNSFVKVFARFFFDDEENDNTL